MDKASERRLLRRVFGDDESLHVEPSEQPDFLLKSEGEEILGVEVTQLHRSSAVAKLTHCRDYSNGLLDGNSRIHQRDIGHFKVGRISVFEEDGRPFAETTAIFQTFPPLSERLNLLFSAIAAKEAKSASYLRQCEKVDLIISDEDLLFYHSSFEEFFASISGPVEKAALISSPFREVYLLTRTKLGSVCIPMRGACFLADCYAYGNLVGESAAIQNPDGIASQRYLGALLACLELEGYRDVSALYDETSVELRHGAWAFLCDGKNVTVHNYMASLRWRSTSPTGLGHNSDTSEIRRNAEKFHEARKSIFATVPIEMRVPPVD